MSSKALTAMERLCLCIASCLLSRLSRKYAMDALGDAGRDDDARAKHSSLLHLYCTRAGEGVRRRLIEEFVAMPDDQANRRRQLAMEAYDSILSGMLTLLKSTLLFDYSPGERKDMALIHAMLEQQTTGLVSGLEGCGQARDFVRPLQDMAGAGSRALHLWLELLCAEGLSARVLAAVNEAIDDAVNGVREAGLSPLEAASNVGRRTVAAVQRAANGLSIEGDVAAIIVSTAAAWNRPQPAHFC